MTYGKKYRLEGEDKFDEYSKLTLKLLRNLINMGHYETRWDVLKLINKLLDERKEDKTDWNDMIREINLLTFKEKRK